jgi:hypothetical protein
MNDLIQMPPEIRYHNGNNERCDMIQGPCACGAYHSISEWDNRFIGPTPISKLIPFQRVIKDFEIRDLIDWDRSHQPIHPAKSSGPFLPETLMDGVRTIIAQRQQKPHVFISPLDLMLAHEEENFYTGMYLIPQVETYSLPPIPQGTESGQSTSSNRDEK